MMVSKNTMLARTQHKERPSLGPGPAYSSRRGAVLLRRTILLVSLCFALSGLTGCQRLGWKQEYAAAIERKAVDPELLRADLQRFLLDFQDEYIALMGNIANETDDRRIQEIALQTKIATVDTVAAVLNETDPRISFVYGWVLVVEGRRNLSEGPARDDFGDQQHRVLALVEGLEAFMIELGRRHFGEEAIRESAPAIEELARRVTGPDRILNRALYREIRGKEDDGLGSILLVPVAPLAGVASAPEAINNVANAMDGLINQMDLLPQRVRWETEMLLLNVESLDTVVEMREDLGQFTDSMENVSSTVSQLPDRIEKLQPELRLTLAQGEKTGGQFREATRDAREALSTIERTVPKLRETISVYQGTLADFRLLLGDIQQLQDQRDPNVSPVDLMVLAERSGAFAGQMSLAVGETRELLVELNQTLSPQGGVSRTVQDMGGLITLITKCLAVLLLAAGSIIVLIIWFKHLMRKRMIARVRETGSQ